MNTIDILSATPDLLPYFKSINEEWIEEMFSLEDTDQKVLENPQTLILDRDGEILFARHPQFGVVGTCALLKKGEGGLRVDQNGCIKTSARSESGRTIAAGGFKAC